MKNATRARNYLVLLARDDILYIRGYHRYYNGLIEEKQRYVFAPDGYCRFGWNAESGWKIRARFSEPKFFANYYGYADQSYSIIGIDRITNTCMRYSGGETYLQKHWILYLKLWLKHPNAELLVKSGYSHLVENEIVHAPDLIDWNGKSVLEMLQLRRSDFRMLRGKEQKYTRLRSYRQLLPDLSTEELQEAMTAYMGYPETLKRALDYTGLSVRKLLDYQKEQNVAFGDYDDYLCDCRKLGYPLTEKRHNRPKHFMEEHVRTTGMVKYSINSNVRRQFEQRMNERYDLEFQYGELFLRQPQNLEEIIAEGRILHHCVGGYADRHANGALHIFFIRRTNDPHTPFYTLELSVSGKIVQCRGSYNANMTEEVKAFVEKYKEYVTHKFYLKGRKQTA